MSYFYWKKNKDKPEALDITGFFRFVFIIVYGHTYVSDLYKAGVDVKQAQYLLGHEDIKTTLDTYTHFGYMDVKVDKLESYYNAARQ